MAVAACHQIHQGRIQLLRQRFRIRVGEDDDGIRLFRLADPADQGAEPVRIGIDSVGRDFLMLDGLLISRNISDHGDFLSGFFQNDVVPGKGHAIAGGGIQEIGGQDGRLCVPEIIAQFIGRNGALLIGRVLRDVPVELMIAERDGVIVHHVHGGADSRTAGETGNRCPLEQVTGVEQHHIVVLTGSAGLTDQMRDGGKTVLERFLAAGGSVHDVAVDIAGFHDKDFPGFFLLIRQGAGSFRQGHGAQKRKNQYSCKGFPERFHFWSPSGMSRRG